jgi:hypothetical protein
MQSPCLILLTALSASGCSTIAVNNETEFAPQFSYGAGRGSLSFQAPPSLVAAAIHQSMDDLGMHVDRQIRNGSVLRVEGQTQDRRSVITTIRSHMGSTDAAVRVGWFGDEPLSRALLHRAQVRLGDRPPESIPTEIPSQPSGNPFFSRDAVSDEVMLRDFAESPYRDRVVP